DLLPDAVKTNMAELSHLDTYVCIEEGWNSVEITAKAKVDEYTWVKLEKRVVLDDVKGDKAEAVVSIILDMLDKLKKIKKMWR
ncbi:hypothetical protein DRO54_10315, partial [Candidatus Bathyarchaeota archaeon]